MDNITILSKDFEKIKEIDQIELSWKLKRLKLKGKNLQAKGYSNPKPTFKRRNNNN